MVLYGMQWCVNYLYNVDQNTFFFFNLFGVSGVLKAWFVILIQNYSLNCLWLTQTTSPMLSRSALPGSCCLTQCWTLPCALNSVVISKNQPQGVSAPLEKSWRVLLRKGFTLLYFCGWFSKRQVELGAPGCRPAPSHGTSALGLWSPAALHPLQSNHTPERWINPPAMGW